MQLIMSSYPKFKMYIKPLPGRGGGFIQTPHHFFLATPMYTMQCD